MVELLRVLRSGKRDELVTMINLGKVNRNICDYQAALVCNKQCLTLHDKKLGKAHPSTLHLLINMHSHMRTD